MRRLLAVAGLGCMIAAVGIAPAHAGADVATTIAVDQGTVTVNGRPVELRLRVRDAAGRPVPGALVRLFVPVEFMGATKDEIVGEGTTNEAGRTVIRFAPAQTGQVEGTLAFWGSNGYAPSEATVSFDIQQPAYTYDPTPVGLQAWWARSYLILVPFAVIWTIYLLLLWLVLRVRRAGAAASAPSDIAAMS
ncbi:MAG: hypothetical protein ACXWYF_07775 [Actinomycetota bacterium]